MMAAEEGASHYTFNSHREGLYRVLEALVRGEPGCAGEPDTGNCRSGREQQQQRQQTLSYPSPFLWYEDMRPSDIDAYHAANGSRGPSGNGSSSSSNSSSSSSSVRLSGDPALGPLPPSKSGSRVTTVPKLPGNREGAAAAAAGLFVEVGLRSPATPGVRRSSEDVPGCSAGVGLRSAMPGSLQPAEEAPGRAGAETAAVPAQHPSAGESPSYAEPRGPCPHGNAGGTHEERTEEEEEGGGGFAAGKDSSGADGRGRRRPDIPGSSNGGRPPMASTTAAAAPATPPDASQAANTQATQTVFLPGLPSQLLVTQEPQEPQEQQQQQQRVERQLRGAGWGEECSEGDESSQEEEDAAAPERAFLFPRSPPLPAEDHAWTGTAAASSSVVREKQAAGGGARAADNGNGDPLAPGGGFAPGSSTPAAAAAAAAAAAREREDEYSRLNDRFTRALGEFARQEERPRGRGAVGGEAGSDQGLVIPRDPGGGARLKPSFAHVSTPEVLSRGGCSVGQAAAVAMLEQHLSLARERGPRGGYAVRALHLACQTLRQPTVCVRGARVVAAGATAAAAAVAAEDDDDHHPEVVGVAGFVWDVLRS